MNQYSNQSRPVRGRGSSAYRYASRRGEFKAVLLHYILPYVIVNAIIFIFVTSTPKGILTVGDTQDFASAAIELKVKSLLPMKNMEVTLDGGAVELTKTAPKTYTSTLKSNGTLKIMLTSVNGMKNIISEQINVLDDTSPEINDVTVKNGLLSVRLSDTQSGVDFSSVHAYDNDNKEILPLSTDPDTGIATFKIQKDNLIICAKDLNGNEVRKTITPQGEILDPEDDGAQDEENTESAEPQT